MLQYIFMQKFLKLFPAFKSHNYKLYFTGQLISLVGTWLQVVAEGWLVLTLTNSPFLIGLVAVCATIPTLFFALFGGVIVDRLPKKNILMGTQAAAMVLAFIYGILTVFHLINIYEIMTLAFLLGVITALDLPARQAITVDLVERDQLSSAITLNGAIFNGSRVIGPGLAGILIALVGPGGAFLLNAASYIPGIIATGMIKIHEHKSTQHPHPIQAIKEGLSYTFSHPTIRTLIVITGIVSIFGWSYSTILPYIVKNNLHMNAAGVGYLYAITGLGALFATVVISVLRKKVTRTGFIVSGLMIFGVSLFGFTFSKNIIFAGFFLFFSGMGLLTAFATTNTSIQHAVEDRLRGRVLSIYILAFMGLFPLGNLEIGWVSERFGPENAIRFGAVIVLFVSVLYYLSRNKRAEVQKEYDIAMGKEEQLPRPILEQAEG